MCKEAENSRPSGNIERQKLIVRRLQLPLSFVVTFTWNNRGELNMVYLMCISLNPQIQNHGTNQTHFNNAFSNDKNVHVTLFERKSAELPAEDRILAQNEINLA